ncbi:MAG: hypothetical protein AAF525_10130 [Pseudomonadota bacterium]
MSEVFCYVDLTDLATYVALDRILALSALSEVTYLPLMVSLNSASGRKPAQETDDPLAAYKARRQRARDAFAAAEHARLLTLAGVTPDIADSPRDGELAHAWLYHVSMHSGSDAAQMFITSVMDGIFRDGRAIEDRDWLRTVSGTADDPSSVPDSVTADQMERGIFKSPGWLIEGERYLGREHLPMMRRLLSGDDNETAPV